MYLVNNVNHLRITLFNVMYLYNITNLKYINGFILLLLFRVVVSNCSIIQLDNYRVNDLLQIINYNIGIKNVLVSRSNEKRMDWSILHYY